MKIKIKDVRLSYNNLLVPSKFYLEQNPNKNVYTAELLVDKSHESDIKLIQDAIEDAKKEGLTKFGTAWKPTHNPIKNGDETKNGEAYKGCLWFRVKAHNSQPLVGIFDRSSGNIKPVIVGQNDQEIYSGCYGAVDLSFFPYKNTSGSGVSIGINAFVKTADGENLSGRPLDINDIFDVDMFQDLVGTEKVQENNPDNDWF